MRILITTIRMRMIIVKLVWVHSSTTIIIERSASYSSISFLRGFLQRHTLSAWMGSLNLPTRGLRSGLLSAQTLWSASTSADKLIFGFTFSGPLLKSNLSKWFVVHQAGLLSGLLATRRSEKREITFCWREQRLHWFLFFLQFFQLVILQI